MDKIGTEEFFIEVKDLLAFCWLRSVYEEVENRVFDLLLKGQPCLLKSGRIVLCWVFTEYFKYNVSELFTKEIITSFLTFLKVSDGFERKGFPVYVRRQKADKFLEKIIENYGKERLRLKPLPMDTLLFLNSKMERYAPFYKPEELINYMMAYEKVDLIKTF